MLQVNNLAGVANVLPSTVKNAVGQPPICDIERIVGRNQIVRYVEFELVKLTSLVSVGNNLNDSQVQFIATQLVEFFPNESLADFKICFQRGCMGQYGEIFRMDGIVIRKWMEQYLEEKYEHVEQKLVKERDSTYYKPEDIKTDSERLQEWKASIDSIQLKKPAPLTREDVLREGQSEPVEKKGTFYPTTPLEDVLKKETHMAYIQANYDPRTAEKKEGWIPEDKWELPRDAKRKLFLDKFPQATEEEIQKYIMQFGI